MFELTSLIFHPNINIFSQQNLRQNQSKKLKTP